jgi:hypothetical protein
MAKETPPPAIRGPRSRRDGGTILGGSGRPAPSPPRSTSDEPPEDTPDLGLASDDPWTEGPAADTTPGDAAAAAAIRAEAPGTGRRVPVALVILCALLAVAAVGMALVAVVQYQTVQRNRDRDSRLRDVSGQTVAALTTYDYQQLDTWKKSVLSNLTGTFAKTFETSVGGYEQVYLAEHNRGTSTIEGVWIGQAKADQASTVVLVRITVTSLTGTHTIEPYVQLTLLKVGGKWRVDDVQYTLDSGSAGAPANSTTAPPGG